MNDILSEKFNEKQEVVTSLLLQMAFENDEPYTEEKIAMAQAVRAAHAQKGAAVEVRDVADALMQIKNQSHQCPLIAASLPIGQLET